MCPSYLLGITCFDLLQVKKKILGADLQGSIFEQFSDRVQCFQLDMKEVARSVKHNFPLNSPSGPFRINCVTSNCCSGQCVLLTMSITVCV